MTDEMRAFLVQYSYLNTFLTNYKILYDYYLDYLFPFLPIKNGSNVIIYGAGNIGSEIINAIESDKRFNLIAWCDKYVDTSVRSEHKIENIDSISKMKYDYIAIAILSYDVAALAKKELILNDIPNEKIIIMSSEVMKIKDLFEIFNAT